MNVIRDLRQKAGLTQAELANCSGTSQSTIAAYESGAKSPTVRTVERIGARLHLQVSTQWQPVMTRVDHRSLAYHRAIAAHLVATPSLLIAQAKENLDRWTKARPAAKALLTRWYQWLRLPVQDLTRLMLDPALDCRDMRQVSPFAGVLSASERSRILKQFQREYVA